MQDPGLRGQLRILAPVHGKTHGLVLAAHDVRHAMRVKEIQRFFPQPAQLRLRAVVAAADDLGIDRLAEQFPARAQRQQPPDPLRARLDRLVRNDQNARAVFRAQMRRALVDLLAVVPRAGERGERAAFQQEAELIPLLKAFEHVRADHEEKLRARMFLHQAPDGVAGIALALAAQLHIAELRAGNGSEGESAQLHPLLRRGTVLRHRLVRRRVVRHDQQAVRLDLARDGERRLGVTQMGGIEAASVQGDLHLRLPSFGSSIFGSFALRL